MFCANVTLCEECYPPPPNPPKNKQQLHILFKSRAAGHPHEHNITERAPAPRTGLSSMMYVADRYLPHQRLRLF